MQCPVNPCLRLTDSTRHSYCLHGLTHGKHLCRPRLRTTPLNISTVSDRVRHGTCHILFCSPQPGSTTVRTFLSVSHLLQLQSSLHPHPGITISCSLFSIFAECHILIINTTWTKNDVDTVLNYKSSDSFLSTTHLIFANTILWPFITILFCGKGQIVYAP